MQLRLLAIAIAVATLVLPAGASARTLNVVASFTVLADIVKEVGGESVTVRSLVPPNGDPHAFEPTPDDARAVGSADLVVISGDGLEPWFARLVRASGHPRKPLIASNGIKTLSAAERGKERTDPHVWNSVPNVLIWAENIENALSAADPENAKAFQANGARYRAELKALDAYAREKISAIPLDKRKVLTSHGAFAYFGREYGVTFLAPVGVSTDSEASAASVAKLIGQIRREKVKAFFIESSNDPRLARQIAAATGAEPGGALYVESLSTQDGPAPTYLRMFRHNVDRLTAAMSK